MLKNFLFYTECVRNLYSTDYQQLTLRFVFQHNKTRNKHVIEKLFRENKLNVLECGVKTKLSSRESVSGVKLQSPDVPI